MKEILISEQYICFVFILCCCQVWELVPKYE